MRYQYKNYNKLQKNILWNAFGNMVYLGCQWLVSIFVTRLFGFEDAGILSLAMSISAVFQSVALFGIRNYQVSDVEKKYSDSTYLGLRGITCIIAMILCLGFSYFNKYDTNQFGAIFWFMLFRLSEDYSDALHGIAQREGRLDIPGKSFFIKGIGTILMFFGGYHITGKLDSTLAIVALTSCAITATFDLLNVKKLACFSLYDRFQRCLALGKETVPLCLYMFLLSAISAVPKYILEKMCDTLALGAYSSIFAPALLIQAAAGYIYSPFVTMFAEYYNKGERKYFVRLAQKLCAVVFGIAIVILAFGKLVGSHVLKMMFGEEILDYSGLLFPILLSTFLTSYLAFFCMMEVVVRDFRGMVAGCMIGLILCSALTPVLIKSVGLNGTSYGMIGGTVGAIVCLSFRLKKKLRKTNKERREG